MREVASASRYVPDVRVTSGFLETRAPQFAEALRRVELFARHDHTVVLLEGEPGTGKTFFARRLHALSRRHDRVFHRVDLGAIDDSLCASDLFGHVTGAFTGAQTRRVGHFVAAQGGTLFLDEVAKASKAVQQKLLHAIEYHEIVPVGSERPVRVDVRLVAATNVALDERVAAGDFLPDLLPRFGHFRVQIPALRERRVDIVPLAEYFVAAHAAKYGYDGAAPVIHPELGALLRHADWPGNVRELDSAVQYLLAASDGEAELTPHHCTGALAALARPEHDAGAEVLSPDHVRRVVSEVGSVSGAARRLGVHRATLHRHLRREPVLSGAALER